MKHPDTPEILEIRQCVALRGTVDPSDHDTPDELVVRLAISYLWREQSDSNIQEGIRSVWHQYRDVCHVCLFIVGMLRARPSREVLSIDLGTVSKVMSGPCRAHDLFILRLVGFEWHSEIEDKRLVSLIRQPRQSGLSVFVSSSIYPHLDLIKDPHDLLSPGQGRILDQSMIDPWLFKSWKDRCSSLHGAKCNGKLFQYAAESEGPVLLIDVRRNCLVPAVPGARYFALSYVWGSTNGLTTKKNNLQRLSGFASLADEYPDIPSTVLDAMRVVRLLGERYLWVDRLCIVQDDVETKSTQINRMWEVYAGAFATIVAAQGDDSNHGLIRVPGTAWQEDLVQEFFKVGGSDTVVERIFEREPDASPQGPWYERAWTFQELMCSTRLIVFERDSVRWECHCSSWFEDIECQEDLKGAVAIHRGWRRATTAGFPDLSAYGTMVSCYNQRKLTFPEDAIFAIAGMTSLLSRTFQGGFNCGLPELFFDIALLWAPWSEVHRRLPSERSKSNGDTTYLPSWSWVGWEGDLDPWVWTSGSDYAKSYGRCNTSRETVPILQWFANNEPRRDGARAIMAEIGIHKEHHSTAQELPPGWTRHVFDGLDGSLPYSGPLRHRHYFYTHESNPSFEFWYPIPLGDVGRSTVLTSPPERYLLTTTYGTTLFARNHHIDKGQSRVSLYDYNDTWVGVLRLHNVDDGESLERDSQCKLVAISRGQADNSREDEPGLDEWKFEQRPRSGPFYEFYNVLWIFWDGNIAYRKGVGRVVGESWEAMRLEELSLILA